MNKKRKAFKPYRVEVEIEDLNIRIGPGRHYDRLKKFTGAGTFMIIDELDDYGLLESGEGWICLDFCHRVD